VDVEAVVFLAADLEAVASPAEVLEAVQCLRVVVAVVSLEVDSLLAPVEVLAARQISRQVAQVVFRPAVTFPSTRPSRASPAGPEATLFKTTAHACC
jgi:hypothetical protein